MTFRVDCISQRSFLLRPVKSNSPFTGKPRANTLRSTAASHVLSSARFSVLLHRSHSRARHGCCRVSAQAQSGSATDSSASGQTSKAVLKQTLSQPATQDSNAASVDKPVAEKLGTLWGLLILAVAYVHHSTCGFALPALLPLITPDLHLSEQQGALLTAGYAVLYAAALIPIGLLADRVNRPRLLAGGLVMWSLLTMTGSKVNSFQQLLATRVGFAAAQATQNPVCFSLIPELFPKSKTTAMAFYNSAIYMGRALSFAAVIVAGQLGMKHSELGVTIVPLDAVDLQHVSLLYTQGEMAAVAPIYDYNFRMLTEIVSEASWRQLLFWLGPPGIVIGLLALLTLKEPRDAKAVAQKKPFLGGRLRLPFMSGVPPEPIPKPVEAKPTTKLAKKAKSMKDGKRLTAGMRTLLASRSFQAITFASALNDVGSWALVSWHATFYTRTFGIGPDIYAPMLAAIIPIGGIIGGVGSGLMGDWLSRTGNRHWLTSGASMAAAPLIALSLLAPEYQQSFAALLIGFALSETWRAPAAVLIREVSPPELGATGSALHLCIRNLVGGCGPLSVAFLESRFDLDLQHAMLLVPIAYAMSGLAFYGAEAVMKNDTALNGAK
ncbi:TPA: hypothetical protein ACH3X3_009229 [Trebouxia sp. C0006]